MPTVISLLNSYAGLSAVAMGFVLENKVLIVAMRLMDRRVSSCRSSCRAMNRSFTNVLFGAFGQVQAAGPPARPRPRRAAPATRRICSRTPGRWCLGHGMAVAQAQHRVREIYDQLTKRGVDVKFAIHRSRAGCRAT